MPTTTTATTVTITLRETGPQSPIKLAPGDQVVWENQTTWPYTVGPFQGPAGSPPLFPQTSYTIPAWGSSSPCEVEPKAKGPYSYPCEDGSAKPPGGIIIVQPPH